MRSRNRGVAYDERTGLKVRGDRLRQDGEKGIWTTDPDPIHPQRFLRNPGPDGRYWTPGIAKNESHGATVYLRGGTWSAESGMVYQPSLLIALGTGALRHGVGATVALGAVITFEGGPIEAAAE